jgi:multidrug efflux pump subunit AcrA (membrane-fusion protein)
MKKIVFGVIILVVGLGGGYWYMRHGPGATKTENSDGEGGRATSDEKHGKAKKEPKPVPVTVALVTKRRILRQVRVVGSLYGQDEITITPKVEGRILKTLADVGDRGSPGTHCWSLTIRIIGLR